MTQRAMLMGMQRARPVTIDRLRGRVVNGAGYLGHGESMDCGVS